MIKTKALLLTTALFATQTITNWALSIDQRPTESMQLSARSPEVASEPQQRPADLRRPVWNMAHMVNSIKELDYRLEKGANSIEVDITFGRDGDPLYTFHGPPCDCWRHCHQSEDFHDYLSYLRRITVDEPEGIGKNLYVMLLDLKLDPLTHVAKSHAGSELARLITTVLFGGGGHTQVVSPLNVVVSINHITDVDLVQHFLHYMEQNNATHLMQRIGFDVGMNDDLQLIETMWKRFEHTVQAPLNLWQGDGFTNCLSPFYNLQRLSNAIVRRNSPTGYPQKVYHWTIDMHERMRESLRMGADVIMTNHPERLLTILQEPDMAHEFRLADRSDNPFKKIVSRHTARETARFERSASSPASSGFFGALIDVISSWWTYVREIPFLSLPTTSSFMPKFKRHKQVSAKSQQITEYRSGSQTHDNLTTTTTTKSQQQQSSISEASTVATTLAPTSTRADDTTAKPYEGPKWYTSLASNVLVSALKIILPESANRHNQTTTDK